MHTSLCNSKYPVKCDLCDEMIESQKDLKKHMARHSYIRATWKCVSCEFVGGSEETMQVHVGKHHSEKFECNLCDYEAKSFEDLETHLFTCEIYECGKCSTKGTTLKEVKTHIESEHTAEKAKYFVFPPIYHTKMDRENFVEVTSTKYYLEDL